MYCITYIIDPPFTQEKKHNIHQKIINKNNKKNMVPTLPETNMAHENPHLSW